MDAAPPPVKAFAALLFRETAAQDDALARLAEAFGPLGYRGEPRPFTLTDYYAAEMGTGLSRCIVAFTGLGAPGELVEAKWRAHAIEQALGEGGRRTVNIDVGYLDLFKVVLASFKGRGNKLYLERGVWADITLTYAKGRFHPLPWSFPDFAAGAYDADLAAIRAQFKQELAAQPSGGRT